MTKVLVVMAVFWSVVKNMNVHKEDNDVEECKNVLYIILICFRSKPKTRISDLNKQMRSVFIICNTRAHNDKA